ncbi:hypothetical protein F5883DRAFT_585665 [Diaporthe sp. PMI_573]|nr:hypothetical protein F5883DRAFT_585665 [Diaporthaceae sp. PMI_573]
MLHVLQGGKSPLSVCKTCFLLLLGLPMSAVCLTACHPASLPRSPVQCACPVSKSRGSKAPGLHRYQQHFSCTSCSSCHLSPSSHLSRERAEPASPKIVIGMPPCLTFPHRGRIACPTISTAR